MSIFNNYDTSGLKYNITETCPAVYNEVNTKDYQVITDYAGNLTKLCWYEKSVFTLTDTVNKNIIVDCDARIYETSGEGPTELTRGEQCQKAYNTVDNKCWTCYGFHKGIYKWEEIPIVENLTGEIVITLQQDMTNKKVISNILNFRREVVYTFESETPNIEIPIDINKYPLLVQGQYWLEEIIMSENEADVIKIIPITII